MPATCRLAKMDTPPGVLDSRKREILATSRYIIITELRDNLHLFHLIRFLKKMPINTARAWGKTGSFGPSFSAASSPEALLQLTTTDDRTLLIAL